MKNFTSVLTAVATAAALSGCNAVNAQLANRTETVEMYHIYDIHTGADTATLAKAASNGIAQNTNSVRTALPLQLGKTVPATPARFTLEDPYASMRVPGMGPTKVAVCNDAVWTAVAKRTTPGSSDLTLYYCLYKYRAGYNLDLYATFQKSSGVNQLPNALAEQLVGSAESWVNKTIVDTVREIERVPGTRVVHLEGQPEISELPAVDNLSRK
jgi:hypothetical protein